MRYRGNGRTIKIPVRAAKGQLPIVEEEARPLLTGPDRYHEQVVEARAEVEDRTQVETEVDATQWEEPAPSRQVEVEEILRRSERRAEIQIWEERWRLLSRLLTVADNLARALAYADENDPLRAGVQLTLDDLRAQLAQEGVEAIQALGQRFDPNQHEAVATDGSGGETVVEVLLTGYTLNGELLRPARVVVGSPAS